MTSEQQHSQLVIINSVRMVASRLVIYLILAYRYLFSLLLGPCCRFEPSCSQYAIQAIETHGLFRGNWLAFKRILRCHPWQPGGFDHVPSSHNINQRETVNDIR